MLRAEKDRRLRTCAPPKYEPWGARVMEDEAPPTGGAFFCLTSVAAPGMFIGRVRAICCEMVDKEEKNERLEIIGSCPVVGGDCLRL